MGWCWHPRKTAPSLPGLPQLKNKVRTGQTPVCFFPFCEFSGEKKTVCMSRASKQHFGPLSVLHWKSNEQWKGEENSSSMRCRLSDVSHSDNHIRLIEQNVLRVHLLPEATLHLLVFKNNQTKEHAEWKMCWMSRTQRNSKMLPVFQRAKEEKTDRQMLIKD